MHSPHDLPPSLSSGQPQCRSSAGARSPYTSRIVTVQQPHLDCRKRSLKRKTTAACRDEFGSNGGEAWGPRLWKATNCRIQSRPKYCYHDNNPGDEVIGRPRGPTDSWFLCLALIDGTKRDYRDRRYLGSAAQERVSHRVSVTSQEVTTPSLDSSN